MQSTEEVILLGDFNVPDINWSTLSGCSDFSSNLCDLIFQHNYVQQVAHPTQIHGNILDLIITSSEDMVSDINLTQEFNQAIKSDHYLINFKLHLTSSAPTTSKDPVYIFDFHKGDYDGLNDFLTNTDFSTCYQSNNVEFIWSFIKSTLSNAMREFIPLIKQNAAYHPKYFTPSIRHQVNCTRTLKKKYNKSPTNTNLIRLNNAEKLLANQISSAKSEYEGKLISDFAFRNQPKIYKYIRNIKKSTSIPNTVHFGKASATNDVNKAILFNKFFYSVFSTSNSMSTVNDTNVVTSVRQHLVSISISEEDVLEALNSLDPDKSSGIDFIGPRVLNKCAYPLCGPLHHLFSTSLCKHTIPYDWRIHVITPVHKSGDKSQVNNYRPISLLSNTSKVLEQLIYNKVIHHISSFLTPQQFGFLKHRSTVQQLLVLFDVIMNTDHQTDVIYFDFKKAFDSVPHNELLFKLKSMGISGGLWLWFKSYLYNRQQCVKINNKYSHLLPVLSGIPQGSILGPLLFLIYVNDIPDHINNSLLYLFADDTKCLKIISDPADAILLQDDINSLNYWSEQWSLLFNPTKIVQISFKLNLQISYTIGTSLITKVESHKDLGIILSSNLTWDAHYNHIIAKAYSILGLLRRTFSPQNLTKSKKQLYISLVRSQLLYCSILWKPYFIKHIQQLERVQRRATKYILNDFTSDYKSRLIQTQLLPLTYILDLNDVMFFIKSLRNHHDGFIINNYIKFVTGNTRSASSNKLHQARSTNNTNNNFYFNRLPRIWNALPIIDLNEHPTRIKNKLSKYLRKHFLNNFNPAITCSFSILCPCINCSKVPKPPNFDKL